MTTTPVAMRQTLSADVAAEIRAWMGRLNINQAQLASRLDQPRQWLSMRLIGRTPIDLNELARIAEALNLSIVDLLPANLRRPANLGRLDPGQHVIARIGQPHRRHTTPPHPTRPTHQTKPTIPHPRTAPVIGRNA